MQNVREAKVLASICAISSFKYSKAGEIHVFLCPNNVLIFLKKYIASTKIAKLDSLQI